MLYIQQYTVLYHSQLRVAADGVWQLAPTAHSLPDVVRVYVEVGKTTYIESKISELIEWFYT